MVAVTPPHYLILPISLNSLDLAGVRLLSPRDSRILPNSCRCDDSSVGDVTKLKWELDDDLDCCYASFPVDQ